MTTEITHPQVGDMVLFRPLRDDMKEPGVRGIVVGSHGENYIYITKETDKHGPEYFFLTDLTPSRVEGFQWEHGAQEYDRRCAIRRLRAENNWPAVNLR